MFPTRVLTFLRGASPPLCLLCFLATHSFWRVMSQHKRKKAILWETYYVSGVSAGIILCSCRTGVTCLDYKDLEFTGLAKWRRSILFDWLVVGWLDLPFHDQLQWQMTQWQKEAILEGSSKLSWLFHQLPTHPFSFPYFLFHSLPWPQRAKRRMVF